MNDLIVTSTDIVGFPLVLIAGKVAEACDAPKLLGVNWLVEGQEWQMSKTVVQLKKYLKLDDNRFEFVDKNSLSKKDATHTVLLTALTQLNEYQNGTRTTFDLPLDMSIGTSFQQRVWQALQDIPYGETISYSQLAQNIDKPTAHRAVANANGKNPFSIIIPCHRVIASNGGLGGYTGGLDKKHLLLKMERATN